MASASSVGSSPSSSVPSGVSAAGAPVLPSFMEVAAAAQQQHQLQHPLVVPHQNNASLGPPQLGGVATVPPVHHQPPAQVLAPLLPTPAQAAAAASILIQHQQQQQHNMVAVQPPQPTPLSQPQPPPLPALPAGIPVPLTMNNGVVVQQSNGTSPAGVMQQVQTVNTYKLWR